MTGRLKTIESFNKDGVIASHWKALNVFSSEAL